METDSYRFAVAGGDMRQWYLAKILAEKGYHVTAYALCREDFPNGVKKAGSLEIFMRENQILIFPVPFFKTETNIVMDDIVRHLRKNHIIFAGCIPDTIYSIAKDTGAKVYDVMKERDMAAKNSIAAAEGIIAEAIKRSPKNLCESHCLVLGYGVCGRTLAALLNGFGCDIEVFDKEVEVLRCAEQNCMKVTAGGGLESSLKKADFIFNTVPAPVLTRERLLLVSGEAQILDMASAPGGVDYAAAEELGISAVLLPGLPGKYAPLSSAQILAETVLRVTDESVFE